MRALFVGSYPNHADPVRSVFFRELIYQFAEQGVECTVISPVSITKYRGRSKEIPLYEVETLPSGKRVEVYRPRSVSFSAKKIGPWNTIHLTLANNDRVVLRQLEKINKQFDFVYGHFFLGGGLTAAKIARAKKIPAYIAYGECNFETEVSDKYGDISPEEMDGVHGIIAVSSANAADLEMRGFAKGIPILLSPNAVNRTVFYPKDRYACREAFGFSVDDFIVGCVGGFIERKGQRRILEACRDMPDIKLAFAGKGPQKLEGEQIVFCAPLEHEKVADFLNALDVFVLPTLDEGCCNAVVEAMSCGTAIVSSELPFNYDVLSAQNSILIDPNDIQAIKEAILTLRDEKELRNCLAEQAACDAQKLSIEQRASNILAFIQRTRG